MARDLIKTDKSNTYKPQFKPTIIRTLIGLDISIDNTSEFLTAEIKEQAPKKTS